MAAQNDDVKGRVRLDLTLDQAELLRDLLLTVADQDQGQRFKILAVHEQVLGALMDARGPSHKPPGPV